MIVCVQDMKTKYDNDRFGIFAANEEEVRQLAKKLNLSVDDVLIAIQEVGFHEEEKMMVICVYLQNSYSKRVQGSTLVSLFH